ncbi:MAG: aldo/keto reductase [Clostridia bacterium]|nr:aldo/keto reductase [Clostridia bacterium]
MEKIKGRLGFGCMRLPMKDGEVDVAEFSSMIDAFIDAGFNYFDTAHGYLDTKSELAVGECLSARYPRDAFILTDKLSVWYINGEETVRPFFESQLAACKVDYFDFYLVHALNRERYASFKAQRAFETVSDLKKEGYIRHIGISFHDTAEVLDMILNEQPSIEVVQLQINYLDYDDPGVQSKACYDVAVKHGKRVIVMEPVKGGALANLPPRAAELFDSLGGGSHASYALRYVAGYPEVFMILSGMGNMAMMEDNIRTMSPPLPLSPEELLATDRARAIIRESNTIPCTACNYCAEVCPKDIPVSGIFAAMNDVAMARLTRGEAGAKLPESPKASDCIGCGRCEQVCPQKIEIRERLKTAAKKLY